MKRATLHKFRCQTNAIRLLLIVLTIFLIRPNTAYAEVLGEDFATNPFYNGWQTFGDDSLFQWNESNSNLEVIWDSSRTNSFFYHTLSTQLTDHDDFALEFDLKLSDIQVGVTDGKNSTFQITVSLMNFEEATRTNYFIGTGVSSTTGPRSLVEWNYFPEAMPITATVGTIVATSENVVLYGHDFPVTMDAGADFHVMLSYDGDGDPKKLSARMTRDGSPFGEIPDITLLETEHFSLNTIAITSYSDALQFPPAGSVLAHGVIDNISVSPPDPLKISTLQFDEDSNQISFPARNQWTYTLQRASNLQSPSDTTDWEDVTTEQAQANGELTLTDSNPQTVSTFYRVLGAAPIP